LLQTWLITAFHCGILYEGKLSYPSHKGIMGEEMYSSTHS